MGSEPMNELRTTSYLASRSPEALPMPTRSHEFPPPPNAAERTSTIRQRIVCFVAKLHSTEANAVFATCVAEVRLLKRYYALSTLRSALTSYRKAVREELGDQHPALKYLRSFDVDMEAVNAVYRQRVFAQHHSMLAIDPDVFIERALDALSASNYGRIVAGLILVTGRRPAEVCHSAEFTVIPDRDDVLMFSGQLKGKGTAPLEFLIPAFADPDQRAGPGKLD